MELSENDHARVAAAVKAAEQTTAGEIYCVLAPEVSDYRETPYIWAAGAALILPALGLLAGLRPDAVTDIFAGWDAAHAAPDRLVMTALGAYVAAQLAVFVIAALLVSLGPVRRALTPKSLKAARVHEAAMRQFLSHGLHMTEGRTGVLLFAALAEHRAEVIADEGIYKAAPNQVWDEVVALLVDGMKRGDPAGGFEAAVKRSGEILAEHVPPRPGVNHNELPDGLVVLPRPGKD